jgi:hypothetical protein
MFDETNLIHSCSRADAIRDGVLIDVTMTDRHPDAALALLRAALWAPEDDFAQPR